MVAKCVNYRTKTTYVLSIINVCGLEKFYFCIDRCKQYLQKNTAFSVKRLLNTSTRLMPLCPRAMDISVQ